MDRRLFTDVKDLNMQTCAVLFHDANYGIVAPLHIGMADIPVTEVSGIFVQMELLWNAAKQEYSTVSFSVSNKGALRCPVNSVLLRKIPMEQYRYHIVRKWLMRYKGNDEYEPFRFDDIFSGLRQAAKNGPSEVNLKNVSMIYSLSRYTGNAPRKAVADAFGISTATATNWINIAQDHGYPIPRQL